MTTVPDPKQKKGFDMRERLQIYLEPEIAERFSAIQNRFGWSASQMTERLFRFYLSLQAMTEGIDVEPVPDFDPDDPAWFLSVNHEDGTFTVLDAGSLGIQFVEKIQEGLTPLNGFGPLTAEEFRNV